MSEKKSNPYSNETSKIDSSNKRTNISRTHTNAISPVRRSPHADVSGLGGWLVLVQIILITTLVANVSQLFSYTIPSFQPDTWQRLKAPGTDFYHPNWEPIFIFDCAIITAVIAYTIYILIPFYRRKRSVPRLMIIFFASSIVIGIIRHWIAQELPAVNADKDLTGSGLWRTVIGSVAWSWYFIASKRVRNTFIH